MQYFFSVWAKSTEAETEYLRVREYLQAVGPKPPTLGNECRLKDFRDRFVNTNRTMVDTQEFSLRCHRRTSPASLCVTTSCRRAATSSYCSFETFAKLAGWSSRIRTLSDSPTPTSIEQNIVMPSISKTNSESLNYSGASTITATSDHLNQEVSEK